MVKRVDLAGAAHLCLVEGAALLRPEASVFEAMLSGWVAQQKSRLLTVVRLVPCVALDICRIERCPACETSEHGPPG